LKSANESKLWIGLIRDTNKTKKEDADRLLGETKEIANILGKSIITMKNKDKISSVKNKSKSVKTKTVKVNVAILGGGDVVFPIIVAGVVLRQFSLIPALIVAVCATLALAGLFYISEKGKFYPAMPFISMGCFIALGIIKWIY